MPGDQPHSPRRDTHISEHRVHQDPLDLDVCPPLCDLSRDSDKAGHQPSTLPDAVHCELSVPHPANTLERAGDPTPRDLLDLRDRRCDVVIVDDSISAVSLDEVERVRRGGRDDFVPDELGELDGEEADGTGPSLDQEPVIARTFRGRESIALMVEETLLYEHTYSSE